MQYDVLLVLFSIHVTVYTRTTHRNQKSA